MNKKQGNYDSAGVNRDNHSIIIIWEILYKRNVSKNLWFACFPTIISGPRNYPAKLLIFAILGEPACYILLML